jgi:hypothetical protein
VLDLHLLFHKDGNNGALENLELKQAPCPHTDQQAWTLSWIAEMIFFAALLAQITI